MASKVSVIVPVYNAEEWLPEAMSSIRSQSYKNIELIQIDDPEGTGAWAARNRGLEKATGDYIAFCDADDYLEPDAIRKMVDAMDGVDLVVGSFRKFGTFEQTVSHPTKRLSAREVAGYVMGNLRNPRSNQLLSGCWAKLYRRELVGRFPKLTTAEDMGFNFDYLTRCDCVRFIEDVVYNNRKRKGSLSTTFNEDDKPGLFGFLEGLQYVERFLAGFGEFRIDAALDNSRVYHTMLYLARICDYYGCSPREAMMKVYPT